MTKTDNYNTLICRYIDGIILHSLVEEYTQLILSVKNIRPSLTTSKNGLMTLNIPDKTTKM